jgi:hypothetical protein
MPLEDGVEFAGLFVGQRVTFDATDGHGKGPRAEQVRLVNGGDDKQLEASLRVEGRTAR